MKKNDKDEKELREVKSREVKKEASVFSGGHYLDRFSNLIKEIKINRPTKFYIAYLFAILAWFSYASHGGLDMLSWTKSKGWRAAGQQYQSGKYYPHK